MLREWTANILQPFAPFQTLFSKKVKYLYITFPFPIAQLRFVPTPYYIALISRWRFIINRCLMQITVDKEKRMRYRKRGRKTTILIATRGMSRLKTEQQCDHHNTGRTCLYAQSRYHHITYPPTYKGFRHPSIRRCRRHGSRCSCDMSLSPVAPAASGCTSHLAERRSIYIVQGDNNLDNDKRFCDR